MTTEQKIDEICTANGLRRNPIGKFPVWLDKQNQEGIALKAGKLESFWIKDLNQIYGEPPSLHIQKVLDEFNKIKDSNNQIAPQNGETALTLTKESLEEWKNKTTFERLLHFQNTPRDLIKYKPKGSKKVPYVEGNVMQFEANVAFLFEWVDEIQGFHFSEQSVACYGSVSAIINNKLIKHSAVGIDLQDFTREGNKPVFTQEELMKNAHTDMIKKALSKFGFNNDVYRGDV